MHQNTLILAVMVGLLAGCTVPRGADPHAQRAVLDRALVEWTSAWSSGDVAKLMPLFSDDVYYEDVTFAAVMKDKRALRDFATTVFGAFTDLSFEPKSRFVSADGTAGAIEWVWRGAGKLKISPACRPRTSRSRSEGRQWSSFATETLVATPTTGTWRRI